jgi:parallel beta-helix repeat protein
MINKKTITLIASFFLVLILAGFVSAETTINSCRTLNQDGETYLLGSDINSASNNCMNIDGDNITLDCQGHRIHSNSNIVAVYANGYSALDQHSSITVKNCMIDVGEYGKGIELSRVEGGLIQNNEIRNSQYALYFLFSHNNSVLDNRLIDSSFGVHLRGAKDNLFKSNIFSGNYQNFFIWHSSHNNYIQDSDLTDFSGYSSIELYNLHDSKYGAPKGMTCRDCIYDKNDGYTEYLGENYYNSKYDSQLTRSWTYQINVIDNLDEPVENAEIEIINIHGETVYTGVTNAEGYSEEVELIEYINNGGDRSFKRDYIVLINKEGASLDEEITILEKTLQTFVLEAVPVAAPNPNITHCTTINESGDYILQNNIDAIKNSCIQLNAPNITLDCQGYSITSDNASTGIYAGDIADQLTIKNCNIDMKTGAGIYLNKVDSVRIVDNNVNGQWHGLYMLDVSNTGILNNDFSNNHYHGIYGRNSDWNVIMNNNIVRISGRGIMLQKDSDDNLITANHIERAIHGIMISESDRTTINSNEIIDSWNNPFSFFRSYSNTIENNIFELPPPAPVETQTLTMEPQTSETPLLTTETQPLIVETPTTESTLDQLPIITNTDYQLKKFNKKQTKRRVKLSIDFEDDDVKKVMYKVNDGKWRKFCSTKAAKDGHCAKNKKFKTGKEYKITFKVLDKEKNTAKESITFAL